MIQKCLFQSICMKWSEIQSAMKTFKWIFPKNQQSHDAFTLTIPNHQCTICTDNREKENIVVILTSSALRWCFSQTPQRLLENQRFEFKKKKKKKPLKHLCEKNKVGLEFKLSPRKQASRGLNCQWHHRSSPGLSTLLMLFFVRRMASTYTSACLLLTRGKRDVFRLAASLEAKFLFTGLW